MKKLNGDRNTTKVGLKRVRDIMNDIEIVKYLKRS